MLSGTDTSSIDLLYPFCLQLVRYVRSQELTRLFRVISRKEDEMHTEIIS
jgi:hypothetical protein